ncbi:MAG TPA: OsmC family protein [Candidatus Angelobacter sp.]|nr:OsmC family protein [Candidatus Angelobacter sp.]
MSTTYSFECTGDWTSDRQGWVDGAAGAPRLHFSAPPEFAGQPATWTPEHFFLAAVVSCFITTFRAIAEFSKFDAAALEVTAEGIVEKEEGGFRFTRVVVRPLLAVHGDADRERGLRLLEKAERACLVSRSLRSEVLLEPAVNVVAVTAG